MHLMHYHEQTEREVNFSDLSTPVSTPDSQPPGSYFAPGSPKMHELRARYKALHDNDLKSSNPDK